MPYIIDVDRKQMIKTSKYLSLILRHQPQKLGLKMEEGGWVDVQQLLRASKKKGFAITRSELEQVVAQNDKQRFALSDDGRKIRASQGHSIDVDLHLEQCQPPKMLYHGTAKEQVNSILRQGISKRSRHHVHLSGDVPTATKVGSRHGQPLVLAVAAQQMSNDGYDFYRSDNGVWLTDFVPAQYLTPLWGATD